MNDSLPSASVLVIKDGKIIDIGESEIIKRYICDENDQINLNQQIVYPGFIDAHCHFYGYAKTLLNCNLTETKSWEEVVEKLKIFNINNKSIWLFGRGWDQNDWNDKTFPNNELLNKTFPNQAVFLQRIDGHAAICNNKALELAGISTETVCPGGQIFKENGVLTGLLLDNAVELVKKVVPLPNQEEMTKTLKIAEKNCFQVGLTTLADAGLDIETVLFLDSLYKKNELNIYQYIMLNPTQNGLNYAQKNGVYESEFLKICSFKLYADGALGSRGAKLKTPYCDEKQNSGLLLNSIEYFNQWCSDISKTDYQVNTHCIGDSANRLLLEIYAKYLKGKNDRRWRIEHAQIIDEKDFEWFKNYNIIPSVQPTHATSDGPWVEHRLCNHRLKGAYAYKTLLSQNYYLPLGTDFPVEDINPLNTFYSAVFRQNINDLSNPSFLIDERLSPWEALQGMTTWAAKSCRLEHRKGQLAKNMDADFIVLNKNLLTLNQEDFKKVKVIKTIRNGKLVYALN